MDLNANLIDYAEVPLGALRQPSKAILSRSMNPTKVLLSEEGFPRDWRGIVFVAGLSSLFESSLTTEKDPMGKVISIWDREDKTGSANFDNLLKFLGKIDRWDVADDLTESLAEDAKVFKAKMDKEKLTTARKNASDACDEYKNETGLNFNSVGDCITNDDAYNASKGLPPQIYDAFILFADEDAGLAADIVEHLEEHPNFDFKICEKNRDFIPGIPIEHEAIIRMITERCRKIIVVISKAFFKSHANTYFMNFANALQIEERHTKIIPCLYEPCDLPPAIKFYFCLKYFLNDNRTYNFWDKLAITIRPELRSNMNGTRINALPSIQIREIKEEPTTLKAITAAPVKKPRTKNSKPPDPISNGNGLVVPEQRLRSAQSMNQLNSLAVVSDSNDNYRSECDLQSVGSADINLTELSSTSKSSSRSFASKIKNFILSGSKKDLSAASSTMSVDSVNKPKREKKNNWLKEKLKSKA